ncbi:MAG: chemotaxis protein CheY, partial [Hyphomicrobiaceae bacterium]
MKRLSIPRRLGLLMLALALPLNLILLGAIWALVNQANDTQRTSLLYAARSITAAVDTKLSKYIMLAEALARSPAVLDDNLKVLEAEARRDFPTGGRAWTLVDDVNGQQ